MGTMDTFITYGAPANLIETVNTMGLPIYAPLAAGKASGGRQKISPGLWEKQHGAKLIFVFRRKGPSLLIAENRRARTGKRGGFAKASVSAMRTGRGLTTVPIFILVPQVTIKKRLDVDGAANKWISSLPGLVVRNWGRLEVNRLMSEGFQTPPRCKMYADCHQGCEPKAFAPAGR